MQKIVFITVLMACAFAATSQNNLKSALLDINKNAGVLDRLVLQIDNALKKDKHKDLGRMTAEMQNELVSVYEKLSTITEPDRQDITNVVTAYKSEVDSFKKLTTKGSLFDNDKLMDETFNKVKVIHKQFRYLLKATYTKALQNEEQKIPGKQEPLQTKDTLINDTIAKEPVHNKTTANETATHETTANEPVRSETTVNNVAPATEVSTLVAESKKKIELYIDSIHLAMKKNNFGRVGILSRNISNNCLQIEDLSLLLKTDQKENIRILSKGLRTYTDELQRLSKKGAAAHHVLHEVLEKSEIKLKSLTVALNLVQ